MFSGQVAQGIIMSFAHPVRKGGSVIRPERMVFYPLLETFNVL